MNCTNCGFANDEGKRFCVECGAALTRRCTACQAPLAEGEKFCGECGARVSAAPPVVQSVAQHAAQSVVAPSAPASAVRKTVTVLFADLGGSTGFGDRTDAGLARNVMARYHATLQEVVDAHGGTVAKFAGDGMMALFGIPEIAEDDARRAVAAGAAMQQRFEQFAAEVDARHDEALTLRVGINTGEVVIADGDADLVGDALNVAARLEKACAPGRVLVGEETWRATRGEFGFAPLGEVSVSGRDQPVVVFQLALGTTSRNDPVAPLVGRDAEMRRLATVLGSPGAPPRTNAAFDSSQRALDLTAASRYEEAVALFRPDFARYNRRRTVSAPATLSADEYLESLRAMLQVFGRVMIEPIALRGQSLHLSRTTVANPTGFEMDFLHVAEVDDDGRLARVTNFDDDDLRGALDELEDRYCAGEGAPHALTIRAFGDIERADARRDWAALAALISPDAFVADRRRISYPLSDRTSLLAMLRQLVELAPDVTLVHPWLEIRGHMLLAFGASTGKTANSSVHSWPHWWVGTNVGGLITRSEYYDVTDGAAARAMFEELSAGLLTPDVDNETVRIHRRATWLEMYEPDRSGAFVADDVQAFDRRRVVAAEPVHSPAGGGRLVGSAFEAFPHVQIIPIAVRGERLALLRITLSSDNGFEIVFLQLTETSASGQITRLLVFDDTDLAAAVEELEARYIAIDGG